MLFLLPLLF